MAGAQWVRFVRKTRDASRGPQRLPSARCRISASRGFFVPARCAFRAANAQRRINGWKAGRFWLRFDESFAARSRCAEHIGVTADAPAPLSMDCRTLYLRVPQTYGRAPRAPQHSEALRFSRTQ